MGMRSLQRALLPAPVKIAFAGLGGTATRPRLCLYFFSSPTPSLNREGGSEMDRVAGRGAAGTVPRPQDGESEPETRADFAGSLRACGGSKGETPPWSQGDSPRKGGRDGGSFRRTVGRGKRKAGSPSKPLDAGRSASSGGMSPSPEQAILHFFFEDDDDVPVGVEPAGELAGRALVGRPDPDPVIDLSGGFEHRKPDA